VLEERGLLDEAIAARREAIRLEPGQVRGWRLGRLLESQSRLDEAIAAYREAVRLDPEDALGWCSLGVALQDVGRFVEARDALRRGHALGSARPDWAQPSERLVRTVEPLAEEEERVGALLDRGGEPASASARAKAARVLLLRDRPAEAARWFARAFEEDAALAEQRKSGWRSCAAVAAARAGLGQGADARALGGGERAGFRERARAWLEAELESADRRSEELRRQLRRWLVEPAFAGVREDAGLAALPEPERAAWTALWTRVRKIVAAAPR
jgi:tetratricopeptide (TPR) repeat protein